MTSPPPLAKSGFIAVAGRPNAGKSTLLNRIAGGKVSIVSHRRQTTRTVIRQITDSADGTRIAWLDTPGWQTQHGGAFNRALNVAAEWAVQTADAIVFLTVAGAWTAADDGFLKKLPADKPVLCALNKIDRIADKNALLPMLAELGDRRDFAAIIPLSGKTGLGAEALITECTRHLPFREHLTIDSRDSSFFFAELVREKIFRALGDELPYRAGVTADVTPASPKLLNVEAEIHVERESQKPIFIGKHGKTLKRIAIAARRDMEKYGGKKVYLTIRVKVSDWRRNPSLLQKMKIGLPTA